MWWIEFETHPQEYPSVTMVTPLRAAAAVMLATAALAKPLSLAGCVGPSVLVGKHCVCLSGSRCTGAWCTSGHRASGVMHVVYGYNPSQCADCKCTSDPKAIDAEQWKFDWVEGPAGKPHEPQHAHDGEDQIVFRLSPNQSYSCVPPGPTVCHARPCTAYTPRGLYKQPQRANPTDWPTRSRSACDLPVKPLPAWTQLWIPAPPPPRNRRR